MPKYTPAELDIEIFRNEAMATSWRQSHSCVQNLNTTNNEDTTVSYRVIILRPDKTPSRVTLTPRFKTTDEASMYGFFRADDYDFELEECAVAANCVLRDNKLVYVA